MLERDGALIERERKTTSVGGSKRAACVGAALHRRCWRRARAAPLNFAWSPPNNLCMAENALSDGFASLSRSQRVYLHPQPPPPPPPALHIILARSIHETGGAAPRHPAYALINTCTLFCFQIYIVWVRVRG